MSIITEALKKAEKERNKQMSSKECLDKILGPERKTTYKREESRADKPQFESKFLPPKIVRKFLDASYIKSKAFITSCVLLLGAIIFLTIANIFFIPTQRVGPIKTSDFKERPFEAEAYTDVKSDIALIRNKMAGVFKNVSVRDEFLSNFTLNGVVHDAVDSWAIINNKVLRVGDTIENAKVISITPQKVVLLFRNERFDLTVK